MMKNKKNIISILVSSLLLILMITIQMSYGAALTVNASGGANYTKIQDAIDNATNGDTIIVYSGTYPEHISFRMPKIVNGSVVVLNDVMLKGVDTPEISKGAEIYGNNVSIVNFIVKKGITNSVVMIYGQNSSIRDNIVIGGFDGIRLYEGASNNRINHNTVKNSGTGIIIDDYNKVSRNNTISRNNFINNSINSIIHSPGKQVWSQNFYDDYRGIDLNGDGFGDQPYNITYSGPGNNSQQDNQPRLRPYYNSVMRISKGWNLIAAHSNLTSLELGEEATVVDPLITSPKNCLSSINRYNTTSQLFEKSDHFDDWGWRPSVGSKGFTKLEFGRGYWAFAKEECYIIFEG